MCMDVRCQHLFAADNHGYVYHWDIKGYAMSVREVEAPPLVKCWRAHIQTIGSIEYIETAKVLISCAADCTIRAWSPDGKYIGTFGQEEVWNLYDVKTYKHPLAPYDVLVDDLSLPEHPIISTKQTMEEVLEAHKMEDKKQKDREQAIQSMTTAAKNNLIDDNAISDQIKNMGVPTRVGKRLRHEITKPMATADKGSKNYYQMLKCFDYDPKPLQIKTPQSVLTKSKNAF